ncbi:hypothetical protein [Deefgea rivuli]|uniref:hypothetical protein n=1 Tax=Deefgea rivuli TaxID=400948 RepID=UPI000683DC46|nr:hypothetical protein [Deefgea rivuli]
MLSKKALHILQHSLGLDEYGQGRQYRNHYVAGEGHHSWPELLALEASGHITRRKINPALIGGESEFCFCVTDKGIDTVAQESPAPPAIPKSKKTYDDYCSISECYDNFAHFLGFDKPEVEAEYTTDTRNYFRKLWRYRMKSSRGCGEWKPTKKEAKASYKADMLQRKEKAQQYEGAPA